MTEPEPDGFDFIAAIAQGAKELFELYTGFVREGFTEDQALKLVIAVIQRPSDD